MDRIVVERARVIDRTLRAARVLRVFRARVETTRGPYDFAALDEIVDVARRNGLGVLWTLAFGDTLDGTPAYGDTQPGDADAAAFRGHIEACANYAAAAKHFAGAGRPLRGLERARPQRRAARPATV